MLGASTEAINVIKQFVADQGITFPILHDKGGQMRSDYALTHAVSPYPRDFIIDQHGVLRFTSTEYRPQTMIAVIESLLGTTAVQDSTKNIMPVRFDLKQNYPNPFNQSTMISFSLPDARLVQIDVFTVNGKRVAKVAGDFFPAGSHNVQWDGRTDSGVALPSGIYLVRWRSDGFEKFIKTSIVR